MATMVVSLPAPKACSRRADNAAARRLREEKLLAQALRFELLPGREEVGHEPLITLRPRGGVPMRIERRARSQAAPLVAE